MIPGVMPQHTAYQVVTFAADLAQFWGWVPSSTHHDHTRQVWHCRLPVPYIRTRWRDL